MKETKVRQLYFYDDLSFKFIKRELENSCLIEKAQEKIVRAWKHFFSNEYSFQGYKNISAGPVTPGFSRDIILDPFDKIPRGAGVNNKPETTDVSLKKWIAKIAENMRYIHRARRTTSTMMNPIEWVLIGILAVEVIAWLARYAWG